MLDAEAPLNDFHEQVKPLSLWMALGSFQGSVFPLVSIYSFQVSVCPLVIIYGFQGSVLPLVSIYLAFAVESSELQHSVK